MTTQSVKKILIVEDEKPLLEALAETFSRGGFNVREAKNGEEGLRRALKEHPDLILLDIAMPKMDGMTVMKKLRKDRWGKSVPIILLTNIDADVRILEGVVEDEPLHYWIKSEWEIENIVVKVKEILGLL